MRRLLALLALAACNQNTPVEGQIVMGKHLITTRETVAAEPEETQYQSIPSTLKDLDDAHFDAAIKKGDTLVLFFAHWCGACREFSPAMDRLKVRHPRVHFWRVDIDANPVSTQNNEVVMVPTLIMFRNGKRSGSLVGAYPDGVLDRLIDDEI
jgi:thioredoxin